jgi:hypothetical protein
MMITDKISEAMKLAGGEHANPVTKTVIEILDALNRRMDSFYKTQQRNMCPKCGHMFYPNSSEPAEQGAVEYAIFKIEEALRDLHCFLKSSGQDDG